MGIDTREGRHCQLYISLGMDGEEQHPAPTLFPCQITASRLRGSLSFSAITNSHRLTSLSLRHKVALYLYITRNACSVSDRRPLGCLGTSCSNVSETTESREYLPNQLDCQGWVCFGCSYRCVWICKFLSETAIRRIFLMKRSGFPGTSAEKGPMLCPYAGRKKKYPTRSMPQAHTSLEVPTARYWRSRKLKRISSPPEHTLRCRRTGT